MTETVIPAPLWRRFGAAVYDFLLVFALLVAVIVFSLPITAALHLPPDSPVFRVMLFLTGFAFFGWFWTRGGQTLGMRAWRLQVRREDGTALRLPVAAVRYAGLLLWWGLVLTPVAAAIIQRFPNLAARLPQATHVAVGASIAVVILLALRGLDTRSRLPQDWLSGTEVVQLPSGR